MNAAGDPGRNALMLNELRLPTIGRLWAEFAQRSDKEGWPASRFLGGLLEHELAERAKRRIERHRTESQMDVTKTRPDAYAVLAYFALKELRYIFVVRDLHPLLLAGFTGALKVVDASHRAVVRLRTTGSSCRRSGYGGTRRRNPRLELRLQRRQLHSAGAQGCLERQYGMLC